MIDAAEDRRRRGDQGRFADPLGAEGAKRLQILDQDGLDRRHVAKVGIR